MAWEKYPNDYLRKQEEADTWKDFHSQFMQFAAEETKTVQAAREGPHYLQAISDYSVHPVVHEKGKPDQGPFCLLGLPECGLWVLSGGE
jgi:hypothetical protein